MKGFIQLMLTKSNFLDFKTCLDEFWLHRQFPDALKEQNSIAQRNALGSTKTLGTLSCYLFGLKGQHSTAQRNALGRPKTLSTPSCYLFGLKGQHSIAQRNALGRASTLSTLKGCDHLGSRRVVPPFTGLRSIFWLTPGCAKPPPRANRCRPPGSESGSITMKVKRGGY